MYKLKVWSHCLLNAEAHLQFWSAWISCLKPDSSHIPPGLVGLLLDSWHSYQLTLSLQNRYVGWILAAMISPANFYPHTVWVSWTFKLRWWLEWFCCGFYFENKFWWKSTLMVEWCVSLGECEVTDKRETEGKYLFLQENKLAKLLLLEDVIAR